MLVEDQYYISGRGVVVTGRLTEGEPWPRLDNEPVPAAMPDGSMLALYITGIESKGTDKTYRPQGVGLNLRGIDRDFDLKGTRIVLERRFVDRRKKTRRKS